MWDILSFVKALNTSCIVYIMLGTRIWGVLGQLNLNFSILFLIRANLLMIKQHIIIVNILKDASLNSNSYPIEQRIFSTMHFMHFNVLNTKEKSIILVVQFLPDYTPKMKMHIVNQFAYNFFYSELCDVQ